MIGRVTYLKTFTVYINGHSYAVAYFPFRNNVEFCKRGRVLKISWNTRLRTHCSLLLPLFHVADSRSGQCCTNHCYTRLPLISSLLTRRETRRIPWKNEQAHTEAKEVIMLDYVCFNLMRIKLTNSEENICKHNV